MVRASFARRVRTRGVIRCFLGKAIWVVELKVTKNFVGRNVVQAFVVLSYSFEDGVGADNVGLDEWPWLAQTIVIVTLGGKMNDNVGFGDEFVDEFSVTDITFDKRKLVFDAVKIRSVCSVGHFVENSYCVLGSVCERIVHKVRPNKPCTARDK